MRVSNICGHEDAELLLVHGTKVNKSRKRESSHLRHGCGFPYMDIVRGQRCLRHFVCSIRSACMKNGTFCSDDLLEF
jgi:hypothetical protein